MEVKYKWVDNATNVKLTAGGILFYDNKGIWVIKELKKGKMEYADIGGKYIYQDGDIYSTIARELSEETFHSIELKSCDLRNKINRYCQKIYVNNKSNYPTYICFLVDISWAKKYLNLEINGEIKKNFEKRRTDVLAQNPFVPKHLYSSQSLEYITFDDLDKLTNVGYRLKMILKNWRGLN